MENKDFASLTPKGEKPKKQTGPHHAMLVIIGVLVIVGIITLVYIIPNFTLTRQSGVSLNAVNAVDRAQELVKIKSDIKNKGAKWEASDNSVFNLSDEERHNRANLVPEVQTLQSVSTFQSSTAVIAPSSMDWRNNFGNYVTPIKDQGNCGSCWAFAVTAGDESYNLITQKTPGTNLDLSEQTELSCSGAGSCSGGGMSSAATFATNTGLPLESCYPYTTTNGSCTAACANWQSSTYKLGSVVSVPQTIDAMEQAISTYGPVTTTFAVYSDFYSYGSGVYSYTSGPLEGWHAVLIVGYDHVGQYFIVKNSWGLGWGEGGYFRIAYSELNDAVDFGATTYAFSSNVPVLSSIVVASPKGSEVWDAGGLTNRTISWNYTGDSTATAKIELMKGGTVMSTIASSVQIGLKSYNWSVPASLIPGADYQIKITGNGSGVSGISGGNFTISAPVPPSLTLTYPIGGESFNPGDSPTIKWNFAGNPGISLKIDLLKGGALSQTIVTGITTTNGLYVWKIPKTQTVGATYQLRITSNSNSSLTSTSAGNFSIGSTATKGRSGK